MKPGCAIPARYDTETAEDFLARVLVERGHISAYEATYGLVYADGRPWGYTRLATVIRHLRESGWKIETRKENTPTHGNGTADYWLIAAQDALGATQPAADERTATDTRPPTVPPPALAPRRFLPECPKTGCEQLVEQLTATVADGVWTGRCMRHGKVTVMWSPPETS